jgi:5-hydroxyisourate hydrolase-like protein (transthyretin family)
MAHKSQGNTLTTAILDLESYLTSEAVYVMLSRVKKSENMRILQQSIKQKFQQGFQKTYRKEFHCLDFLHTETLNSSTPPLVINNHLGRLHDLQNIERWYNRMPREQR